MTPQIQTAELTDGDLDNVAGGVTVDAAVANGGIFNNSGVLDRNNPVVGFGNAVTGALGNTIG